MSVTNILSNSLFYCQCYPSFLAALCLSHTLSLFLSLSCLALTPASFVWYKNPGIHFHLIIDRNKPIWTTSLFHLEVAHNTCTFTKLPKNVSFKILKLILWYKLIKNNNFKSICRMVLPFWAFAFKVQI
jgi:hypothetical protein